MCRVVPCKHRGFGATAYPSSRRLVGVAACWFQSFRGGFVPPAIILLADLSLAHAAIVQGRVWP